MKNLTNVSYAHSGAKLIKKRIPFCKKGSALGADLVLTSIYQGSYANAPEWKKQQMLKHYEKNYKDYDKVYLDRQLKTLESQEEFLKLRYANIPTSENVYHNPVVESDLSTINVQNTMDDYDIELKYLSNNTPLYSPPPKKKLIRRRRSRPFEKQKSRSTIIPKTSTNAPITTSTNTSNELNRFYDTSYTDLFKENITNAIRRPAKLVDWMELTSEKHVANSNSTTTRKNKKQSSNSVKDDIMSNISRFTRDPFAY